jgi:hypothetical protein
MSYKRFDQEDVVVSAEGITAPLWTGDQTTLTAFFTASDQIGGASGDYYYDIYQTGSTLTGARVQFSVAYADKLGSGSQYYNINVPGKTPSGTTYGQYRTLVLGDEEANFTFGSTNSDYFYVINVDRARYKEKLLPGTFRLQLATSASNLTLVDDSNFTSTTTFNDAGRVYELVSGSLTAINTSINQNGYSDSGSYGKFLPDIGVILLNGKALDAPIGSGRGGMNLQTQRNANSADKNIDRLYDALVAGGSFRCQSEETVSSNFIFVRARNGEFNYSTNPSLITGSGEIRHNVMINSPQSYITAVGLYNDNNDLLAVAKLSRPLVKDFTKESLIRIKLDY